MFSKLCRWFVHVAVILVHDADVIVNNTDVLVNGAALLVNDANDVLVNPQCNE
jgi:hypothetical protein